MTIEQKTEIDERIKRVRSMVFAGGGVKTRLMRTLNNVKAHGYFRDAIGVTSYHTGINPPKVSDPTLIAAYYAGLEVQ